MVGGAIGLFLIASIISITFSQECGDLPRDSAVYNQECIDATYNAAVEMEPEANCVDAFDNCTYLQEIGDCKAIVYYFLSS